MKSWKLIRRYTSYAWTRESNCKFNITTYTYVIRLKGLLVYSLVFRRFVHTPRWLYKFNLSSIQDRHAFFPNKPSRYLALVCCLLYLFRRSFGRHTKETLYSSLSVNRLECNSSTNTNFGSSPRNCIMYSIMKLSSMKYCNEEKFCTVVSSSLCDKKCKEKGLPVLNG